MIERLRIYYNLNTQNALSRCVMMTMLKLLKYVNVAWDFEAQRELMPPTLLRD